MSFLINFGIITNLTMMKKLKIALLGGGPSALYMYKQLIESADSDYDITIFEKRGRLGAGMPYSGIGANSEHITNVSGNEIPSLMENVEDWIRRKDPQQLIRYGLSAESYHEYKVLPRLVFGSYLEDQFSLLLKSAEQKGIKTQLLLNTEVTDVSDRPVEDKVRVFYGSGMHRGFDKIVICTGHFWPRKHESTVPGYYDSPYPPAKLSLHLNHPVALRGSSLTAIDAIRTLARHNGRFIRTASGSLSYQLYAESKEFRIVMHWRHGFLPAVRFHLDDPHLKNASLLTTEEIQKHRAANEGFISLDFMFTNDFIALFKAKEPDFYQRVKNMNVEDFVDYVMSYREEQDSFALLCSEYFEAEQSIKRHRTIYWKELLAVLSFAMNYPAKYLSAEDMLRLKKVLQSLISVVIAFVPQSSCRELIALHQAGCLDIVAVGEESEVIPLPEGGITYRYRDQQGQYTSTFFSTFVYCTGQCALPFEQFLFQGLLYDGTVSPARLKFRSQAKAASAMKSGAPVTDFKGDFFLTVPGIAVTDHFAVVDREGLASRRVYMMAVPFMGGFNPDYSGLDFCEAASVEICKALRKQEEIYA
ncbi:FAD/NAD(P)-binding protein [Flavobacterium sp. ST-75]|uniref:FAD/NAD(P)-binding protein n=1 Tax=Flavobacterium rhizophilum TaxID=3163296 RepID=A0ABW8Y9K8_9FLAO